MFRIIKLVFYLFVFVILFEAIHILHEDKGKIHSSVREIGDNFMDTTWQIINESENNMENGGENIR